MNKFYSLLFTLFIVCANSSSAQNSTLIKEVNDLIKADNEHLPKLNFQFLVDSVSINEESFNIFFNCRQSFTKNSLPADYVEMLPELLMRFAEKTQTKSVLLFAKDQSSQTFKTLNYFANHPQTPIYKAPKNNEAHPDIKVQTSNVVTRVFPGGTGSPIANGVLAGKTVWLSPGHGWHNTGAGFVTQRGTSNEIVEDFTTIESINNYLLYYLTNAGANVWSVRERDVNTNEIIVDNDVPSSGYSETGTWTVGSLAGYGGTYKVATASATETATAIYVPNVTQSGLYWVSVRCIAGSNRPTDVSYTIIHSGDTSVVKVNQEIHSDTWVYVGQFYFTAGSNNRIIQSNFSAEVGEAVIADAVRLGGGIGATLDCLNTGQPASGRARMDESARQYAIFQKYPTCTEDVTVRPKYAEYEATKGTSSELNNSVYVSFHTNAGGGTGTETYSYDGLGSGRPTITAGSTNLRGYIHNQIVADIRAGWKPTWADRGVKVANFGEIRELNTMPGTLIELAFHDKIEDATDLKQPEFRRLAARAIYKGILKFFNNRDGVPLVYLPEEPTHVVAKNAANNTINLTWNVPVTGGIFGSAATGYKVYISTNGKSFKDGAVTATNNFTFTGNAQTTYFFKITATNAGGESFASGVVAARTPMAGSTNIPYLIVDGFDRIDSSALIPRVESSALGTVKRMFLDRMNRYDYIVEHALALSSCNNMAFDGCQNEAVINGSVLLANYSAVDWFVGEDGTSDYSLNVTERSLLKTYLNNGGNLLVSGAEIGFDLGRAASINVDLDFYNNFLKANYLGDDANSYSFAGTSTFFDAQTGVFDNSTNGYYDVDFPDRLSANSGSNIALNYVGGTADGAAVGFKGSYNLLYLAFPFETITSSTARNNLMCNAVGYLTPSVLPATGLLLTGSNNGTFSKLSWTTTAETNIKEMLLQRSDNGIIFYDVTTAFLPKGSWNVGASYAYTDNFSVKAVYYRVKVIDKDGKQSLSNTILLKTEKSNKLFVVLNNPTTSAIKISVNINNNASLQLINSVGQVVYKSNITASMGSVQILPITSLSKGVYNLVMIAGSEKQIEKIIVQ